jgi:MerR family transcriptional regulator, light-induced transcriptional regulator
MQRFRDIENLTGIKAHTLRIWEQRYGFFTPQRKESQHRFYDNEDLKKLLRISYLYHNGWKVSKIAELNHEQISETVRNTDAQNNYPSFVAQLIEASIDFDEHRFLVLLNGIIEKTGFEKCITEVCYPFLQKVGLLWSTNNVLPAQEHFSSYIIQNKIISETEKVVLAKSHKPQMVLYCPKGEFHELPLLFINYLLKKNDWGTIYLGANVDPAVVKSIAQVEGIRYIYLHLITNFTGLFIDDYLEALCKTFPDKTIVASGVEAAKAQRHFVNVVLLRKDEDIYRFIQRLT